jgi:glycosyltransferase involved in cell wall biosynthesis
MKLKSICIVAPVHYYDDVRVFQKQAVSLATDSYNVKLYARAKSDLIKNNIQVIATPTFKGRIKRFLFLPVLVIKLLRDKSDVYLLHNPDTLPLLFILKLFGRKVVYDTHEDFSKRILMRGWLPQVLRPFFAKLIESLERVAYLLSDAFIVTQSALVKKYGKESFLVENAPIVTNELLQKVEESYVANELSKIKAGLRLVYVGGISIDRGIIDTLNGLSIINLEFPCQLVLIGPASTELLSEMEEHIAWKYVSYKGVLPQCDAFSWIRCSDVGLIWLRDIGDYSETSPNKLFEYGAMGIPFIATNFKLWHSRLSEYNSGVFIEPESIVDFVNGVQFLYDNSEVRQQMGYNGNSFVHDKYNWSIEYRKFKLAIDKALK